MFYEFDFQTGRITIDYNKCKNCGNYACIKACSLFGRSILRIDNQKPVLISSDANKRCIEDLACELYCQKFGMKGLRITLNDYGLSEYRKKIGLMN
jgi:NAD-dependent dihydropyrimidine dehydrogenase PreA subunit